MKYHVLLTEDIWGHGRKGDLVYVAPGFARNFLLPKGKALLASAATINMRERLKEERLQQAIVDKKSSEALAAKIKGNVYSITVKVDPDGHMYGSVSQADIVELLAKDGLVVEKKHIAITHPIRQIGSVPVCLKLPEGVIVEIALEVKPDREIKRAAPQEKVKAETPKEEKSEEEGSE